MTTEARCAFCGARRDRAGMARMARDGGGYEYACAECSILLEDAPDDE